MINKIVLVSWFLDINTILFQCLFLFPEKVKIKRRKWSEKENESFRSILGPYLQVGEWPSGNIFIDARKAMGNIRSIAQIRAKFHNILAGKQRF